MSDFELSVPPNNQEAERALLGAILLDNSLLGRITGANITADDFYNDNHSSIFTCILQMDKEGLPIDAITLAERLGENLERMGGPSFLGILAASATNLGNVEVHANLVKEKSQLRAFILLSRDLGTRAFEVKSEAEKFFDGAEREFFAFSEKRNPGRFVSLDDVAVQTAAMVAERARNPLSVIGVSTGFTDLDFQLAGLQPAELTIIAARPSMGKTALGLNMAMNAVTGDVDILCAFFSLEMDKSKLGIRLLASETGIDSRRLQRGDVTAVELETVSSAAARLKAGGLFIDDSSFQTVASIAAKCRRLARIGSGRSGDGRKLGLVVVDYLTLVSSSSRDGRHDLEVGEITWGLKKLAKELQVPVVLLSQLNRKCEERSDKRPLLSDLRDSGNIEQDADTVLFIYRDVRYNPDAQSDLAELIIAKQRNGPCSTVKLRYVDECTKFENMNAEDVLGDIEI